jgi:hypothetical protein
MVAAIIEMKLLWLAGYLVLCMPRPWHGAKTGIEAARILGERAAAGLFDTLAVGFVLAAASGSTPVFGHSGCARIYEGLGAASADEINKTCQILTAVLAVRCDSGTSASIAACCAIRRSDSNGNTLTPHRSICRWRRSKAAAPEYDACPD